MTVIILRHGKAERDSASGRDEDRELRPRGRRQAQWIGERLAADDHLRPAAIISSPATRAIDTARIVAEVLGLPVEEDDRLSLSTRPQHVIELIQERAESGAFETVPLLLVGHNPTLEIVLGALIADDAWEDHLSTGEAVAVEIADGDEVIGAGRERVRLRLDE